MKLRDIQNTYHDALDAIYGVEEVDSFFYILIENYFGVSRLQLAVDHDLVIHDSEKLTKALALLKKDVPLQYIIGETEFYGLPFKVSHDVLIPRPETEELVDWILKKADKTTAISILDIGTGSGCIAVSLAKNLPEAKIYALDVSSKAIDVAKQNAEINGVGIEFIEADILIDNPSEIDSLQGKFDIIVSNPPYVREKEKQLMKPNVLQNEPHLALFVKDEKPLLFYEAITRFASKHLNSNGQLFFEINEYLGSDMIVLLNASKFEHIELKQDIFKKDRMIKGIKG